MPDEHSPQLLGERAASVGGSVDGDVITGDKRTTFDQREQQVQYQVNIVYQGVEVAIPSPQAIAAHRAALRERLEREAKARWGGMGVYIQEEGATLPIEASPYQQGRLGPRTNLLETLKRVDRLLVLGEPGAGKTVALERLAWELCNNEQPAIPVLVRLFRYAGTPLAEWLRDMLRQTGHLRLDDARSLEAFLEQGGVRCVFLLDGLNEVAPPYRDRLVDEVVRWLAGHPRHAAVLTSRAQDELWRRLRDAAGEVVVVQPITDAQAQGYLETQLPGRGTALYTRLDERLRALAQTPLLLWLIKEAGAAGESLPGNRGELYARFVSRLLRRDTERRIDAEIPEAQKLGALTTLADGLSRRQQLTCSRAEAVALVANEWGERAELLLDSCQRHGLLAGEELLWFAPHQTVQEHFAARALQARWERERKAGWRDSVRRWFRPESGVAALASDAWWAETFVQAAGMIRDADTLAQAVARKNPWLALWCLNEGREVSEATRAQVEARSVKLLEAPRLEERRRAVQALAQLRNERVIAPLFRAAGDEDAETAQTAIAALGDFGEAVKPLALAALQGRNLTLWRATLRWLVVQPDETLWAQVPPQVYETVWGMALVYVPAGPFLMGSDKARDPQALDDELPQHEVSLPGYWIGKYPVTVAQFREFAADYRWADRESLQGPEDRPMVNVTWRRAQDYCRWLAQKTGLPVTLPSEAEWEKAARGTDGRVYPWGDTFDKDKCNSSEGGVGRTTPVGKYSPAGDSPFGCADMAGNVWEWTRSHWKAYPYDPLDGREDLEVGDKVLRVLRGGSFSGSRIAARCSYRLGYMPDFGGWGYGFRVVVAPSREAPA